MSILVSLLLSACGTEKKDKSFADEHARRQEERVERLKSGTGWLNLAGLYWLDEGENTIGSDSSNSIVFPENAPAHIGKYILENGRIRFVPTPGEDVMHGGTPATQMEISTDRPGDATLLESGSLAWFLIERSPRYGIRLRDYEHPAIGEFHGIETFPADADWKILAEFEAFREPGELLIPTVIGTFEKNICPGVLRFSVGGVEQKLYPSEAGDRLFIIFADETSGLETYGSGRFLYTDKPGKDGTLVIDFNRAYNPPLRFYTLCHLSPSPKGKFSDCTDRSGGKVCRTLSSKQQNAILTQ